MVLDFRVPHLPALLHPRILTRGTTSKAVTRPKQPRDRTLSVRRTFEPSRMASDNLATAYEQIVPIVRRLLKSQHSAEELPAAPKEQRNRIY